MDPTRFDRWTKRIACPRTRRAALGALLSLAAPAALGARRVAAGTRCIRDGENCTDACPAGSPCNACCNGFCAAYGGCTDIGYLDPGSVCDLGVPNECRSGYTCCPFRPGQRHGQGTCQDVCY